MAEARTTKPFPWKCTHCREKTVRLVVIPYSTQINHDGRSYQVVIPGLEVARCEKCGEVLLHDMATRRISEAFRQGVGLLTPEQIRKKREALGLTQKELANFLGIAEATLSRWETGSQIHQRSLDRLLRLFFAFENVRDALRDEANLAHLGMDEPKRFSEASNPTSSVATESSPTRSASGRTTHDSATTDGEPNPLPKNGDLTSLLPRDSDQGPILIRRNPPFKTGSQSQLIHQALEKAGPLMLEDIAAFVRAAGQPCDASRVKNHINYWLKNYHPEVYVEDKNGRGWYLNPRGVEFI
jgi:putative zinc finger/helix-turn-helix YgiT family protein